LIKRWNFLKYHLAEHGLRGTACDMYQYYQRQHDYMDFGSHGFLFNVEFDRFGMIDLDLGFSDHIGLAIAGFLYGLKVL